jgi:DNA-binding GntR family transcriptional regulator
MKVETLNRRGGPASDQARHALREAIVSAQLAPGLKLSENELAGELGVSRTPIRHHLRMVPSNLPRLRELHPDYFEEGRAWPRA